MGHDWDICQWPQHCSRPKTHQNVPTKSNLSRNVYMYCGFQSYLMQNFFWSIQSRISFDKKCSVSYFTFGIYALPSIMPQKILIHSKAKHCQRHSGSIDLEFGVRRNYLEKNYLDETSTRLPPLCRPLQGRAPGPASCDMVSSPANIFHFCKCFYFFANIFTFANVFSFCKYWSTFANIISLWHIF